MIIVLSIFLSFFILVILVSVLFFSIAVCRKHNSANESRICEVCILRAKYKKEIIDGNSWINSMHYDDIYINSRDGLKLHGIYLSNENSKRTLILFHGYGSVAIFDLACIARFYYNQGFNILIPDQRTHGSSEGKYIGFGVLEKFDCVQWIDYINNNYNLPDVFLYGVSMGATTVLMAAGLGLPKNVKGIISDCGFTSIKELFAKILIKDFKISKFPIYYMASIMSKVLAGYYFKDGSTVEAVKNSKIPLLIFHGGNDSLIPKNMSKSIYDASVSEYKRICIIENADHAECYASDSIKYEHESIGFLNRIA